MKALTALLRRPATLTLLLIAACWPVWLACGWLLDLLGMESLGLVGCVCSLFLFLSIAEIALEHVAPHSADNQGPSALS